MRTLILLLLALSPIFSQAQEPQVARSKFAIALNFSPNFAYRSLIGVDSTWGGLESTIEGSGEPTYGLDAGIAIRYRYHPKVEVELGLQFENQRYLSTGLVFTGIWTEVEIESRFYNLNIPLKANYIVHDGKLLFYVACGAWLSSCLDFKQTIEVSVFNPLFTNEVNTRLGGTFNNTRIGILAGMGLGWRPTKRFELRGEPILRCYLTPLYDIPIKRRYYALGCQVQLGLRF